MMIICKSTNKELLFVFNSLESGGCTFAGLASVQKAATKHTAGMPSPGNLEASCQETPFPPLSTGVAGGCSHSQTSLSSTETAPELKEVNKLF